MQKRIKNICVLFLLSLTALFVAVACSQKEEQEEKEEYPVLVIGSKLEEPYSYMDEAGNLVGVDVDIATEACRRLGYKPVFKQIVWENGDDCLEKGEVDCLWGKFTTAGDEEKYLWAGPYLCQCQAVVVQENSGIYTLEELADKRVAVQAMTVSEELLLEETDKRIPKVSQIYSLPTVDEIFACLRKEYVDAIAGHKRTLNTFVQSAPEVYRMLEESLYVSHLGVAFQSKEHEALARELDETLKKMVTDGTIGKIVKKYGLDEEVAMGVSE